MQIKIKIIIWAIWMRIPKPWNRRKYEKILERMQEAAHEKQI